MAWLPWYQVLIRHIIDNNTWDTSHFCMWPKCCAIIAGLDWRLKTDWRKIAYNIMYILKKICFHQLWLCRDTHSESAVLIKCIILISILLSFSTSLSWSLSMFVGSAGSSSVSSSPILVQSMVTTKLCVGILLPSLLPLQYLVQNSSTPNNSSRLTSSTMPIISTLQLSVSSCWSTNSVLTKRIRKQNMERPMSHNRAESN